MPKLNRVLFVLFVYGGHGIPDLRVFSETCDASTFLSGRVDISRAHCIIRDGVSFTLESSWAFKRKRESDRKVTKRERKKRRRKRERERER